ncbi:MAG: hypothetical protein H7Y86_12495 [Rhizobacter sp.]|nr:hypothetical protein [Ferruginibacter sp.]
MIKKNNIDGFKIDIYKKDWEILESPCNDTLEVTTSLPAIAVKLVNNDAMISDKSGGDLFPPDTVQ